MSEFENVQVFRLTDEIKSRQQVAQQANAVQLTADQMAARGKLLGAIENGHEGPLEGDLESAAEQMLGRKLSTDEAITASVKKDDKLMLDDTRIEAALFRPVMPQAELSQLEMELQQAKQEAFNEAFQNKLATASEAEARVLMLEKTIADEKAKEEQQASAADQAAQRKPMVDLLNKALRKAKIDPLATPDDIVKIELALQQVQTFGSCDKTCSQMTQDALSLSQMREQEMVDTMTTSIQQQQTDLDALKASFGL